MGLLRRAAIVNTTQRRIPSIPSPRARSPASPRPEKRGPKRAPPRGRRGSPGERAPGKAPRSPAAESPISGGNTFAYSGESIALRRAQPG